MFPRALVIAFLVLGFWGVVAHNSGASSRGGGYYVVKSEDTLWSIADRYYGGDTRVGVWQLEQQNGLEDGASIEPGERLRLPW